MSLLSVSKELKSGNRNHLQENKGNTSGLRNIWKVKIIHTDTGQLKDNQQRSQIKLTPAQLDEKRRLGLCFKCDSKWFKQNKCPNKEF